MIYKSIIICTLENHHRTLKNFRTDTIRRKSSIFQEMYGLGYCEHSLEICSDENHGNPSKYMYFYLC